MRKIFLVFACCIIFFATGVNDVQANMPDKLLSIVSSSEESLNQQLSILKASNFTNILLPRTRFDNNNLSLRFLDLSSVNADAFITGISYPVSPVTHKNKRFKMYDVNPDNSLTSTQPYNAIVSSPVNSKIIYGSTSPTTFYSRKPYNPIVWDYIPKVGSYIALQNDSKDVNNKYNRFKHFPVTYWIQPCSPEYRNLTKAAINEFDRYFPMREVSSIGDADLSITFINLQQLQKLKPHDNLTNVKALGGYKLLTQKLYDGSSRKLYKGFVYVLNNSFGKPDTYHILVHEIGHAFGLINHSDSDNDVMYFRTHIARDASGFYRSLNKTDNLSPRDLNTLYLIYND